MGFDTRVHVGVAAILLQERGGHLEMLLLKRGASASHGAGTWGPPGGWLEHDESPEVRCAKEVKEETGLYMMQVGMILDSAVANTWPDPINTVVCLFYQGEFVGEPVNREPDKHDEIGWFTPREMKEMDLFPPLKSFLTAHGL